MPKLIINLIAPSGQTSFTNKEATGKKIVINIQDGKEDVYLRGKKHIFSVRRTLLSIYVYNYIDISLCLCQFTSRNGLIHECNGNLNVG